MKSRRLFVAGNWKMNLDRQGAIQLADAVETSAGGAADVAVCPPFPYLIAVRDAISGTGMQLGAQDLHYEKDGAFTGGVSAAMLLDCGCRYVIVGHSERRQHFGETDETVNRKVRAALSAGLQPILCVGETLPQREGNETDSVITSQLRYALMGVMHEELRQVTVAYEPVWAIGTGKVASPDQAQAAHATLREVLRQVYGNDLAQSVRLQYGGSVKPDNAAKLLALPDVDGALVGGASLKAEDFLEIVRAAQGAG